MSLSKFNLKFKQNRDEQFNKTSIYYCRDTACFEELRGEESIIDTILRVHSSPISWYNPIQNLLSEFDKDMKAIIPFKVDPESAHYNQYGAYVWDTLSGYEIKVHDQDRELSEKELDIYGSDCIGEQSSNRIYDRKQHVIYKYANSVMNKLGFISLHNPDKSPNQNDNSSRMCNQFTPFSALLTTRITAARRGIRNDSFMSTIGIKDENNKPVPIRIPHEKYSLRSWKIGGYECKHGYYLTDCIAVVDIDNGIQIDGIMNAISEMPFLPQLLIVEKGIGQCKAGNATAQFVFNRPITKEERKLFMNAIRTYIAYEHNIYAIDSKATGIGFGKNPISTYNNELTHRVFRLNKPNYADTIDVDLMIKWSNEVVSTYEIPKSIDTYVSCHKDLMRSSLSFAEILTRFANDAAQQSTDSEAVISDLWEPVVNIGTRNNTLVYKEIPVYCLQYWNIYGMKNITNGDQVANDICHAIWYDTMQRYDNSDHAITWKYIYTRVLNCVNKDIQRISTNDEEFLKELKYQRNIMLKFNESRLLQLQGKQFTASKLANIDFSMIESREHSWSYAQSQRGGMVQMLKSVMYATTELSEPIKNLLPVIIGDYRSFVYNPVKNMKFAEFHEIERKKVKKALRPYTSNDNRLKTVTNLLICRASMSANKILLRSKLSTMKLKKSKSINDENVSVTGFSFIHSADFVTKMLYGSPECELELYEVIIAIIDSLLDWGAKHDDIHSYNQVFAHHCTQFTQGLYIKYNIDTNIVYMALKTISQGYTNGRKLRQTIANEFCKELSIEIINAAMQNNSVKECSELLGRDYRAHEDNIVYHTRIYDIIVNTLSLLKNNSGLSKNSMMVMLDNMFSYISNVVDNHDLSEQLRLLISQFVNKLKDKLIEMFFLSTHTSALGMLTKKYPTHCTLFSNQTYQTAC